MAVIREFAEARLGLPRRHDFLAGDAGDLFGVFADIAIVEEGKRGDFAGAMADGAVLEDDEGDVLVEGWGGVECGNCREGHHHQGYRAVCTEVSMDEDGTMVVRHEEWTMRSFMG